MEIQQEKLNTDWLNHSLSSLSDEQKWMFESIVQVAQVLLEEIESLSSRPLLSLDQAYKVTRLRLVRNMDEFVSDGRDIAEEALGIARGLALELPDIEDPQYDSSEVDVQTLEIALELLEEVSSVTFIGTPSDQIKEMAIKAALALEKEIEADLRDQEWLREEFSRSRFSDLQADLAFMTKEDPSSGW
jgi:hypothetical protein